MSDGVTLSRTATRCDGRDRADRPSVFAAADAEFHTQLVSGARNSTLSSLLENLSTDKMRDALWRVVSPVEAKQHVHDQHRQIVGAMQQRDPLRTTALVTGRRAEEQGWLATFGLRPAKLEAVSPRIASQRRSAEQP
ncbi:MAG TPA: FCD domain-containing protein [Mycobacteriales bacterium]|nr:FCD domain-containing protein [Mycobacteriales bacterium]